MQLSNGNKKWRAPNIIRSETFNTQLSNGNKKWRVQSEWVSESVRNIHTPKQREKERERDRQTDRETDLLWRVFHRRRQATAETQELHTVHSAVSSAHGTSHPCSDTGRTLLHEAHLVLPLSHIHTHLEVTSIPACASCVSQCHDVKSSWVCSLYWNRR